MPAPVSGSFQQDIKATQDQPAIKAGSSQSFEMPMCNDIAWLAYVLWQQRGCPQGSAEKDWVEAEQQSGESSTRANIQMIRG
jgi:hypothetical protein